MSAVDGATHTQKDGVESNGGSLENVAEMFCAVLLRRSAGFEAWCPHHTSQKSRVGQNHIPIRFIYDIFGREITKYTVIYGVIYGSGLPYKRGLVSSPYNWVSEWSKRSLDPHIKLIWTFINSLCKKTNQKTRRWAPSRGGPRQ